MPPCPHNVDPSYSGPTNESDEATNARNKRRAEREHRIEARTEDGLVSSLSPTAGCRLRAVCRAADTEINGHGVVWGARQGEGVLSISSIELACGVRMQLNARTRQDNRRSALICCGFSVSHLSSLSLFVTTLPRPNDPPSHFLIDVNTARLSSVR